MPGLNPGIAEHLYIISQTAVGLNESETRCLKNYVDVIAVIYVLKIS